MKNNFEVLKQEINSELLLRSIFEALFCKPAKQETINIYSEFRIEMWLDQYFSFRGQQNKIDYKKITVHVLKEMFCEDTGYHFLDSSFGRQAFKRRRLFKECDWTLSPRAVVEIEDYGDEEEHNYCLSFCKNTYIHLLDVFTYDPKLDAEFHSFASKTGNSHWLKDMEEFAEKYDLLGTYNTYNDEVSVNVDVQCVAFKKNGISYVVLQSHNGADIRGGYSVPHVFEGDYENFRSNIFTYHAYCDEKCGWGSFIALNEFEDTPAKIVDEEGYLFLQCPECGGDVSIS